MAAGYTIAICQKIAENLRRTLNQPDLRVRHNTTMAVTRGLPVRENVIDMDCGATSHTASREKLFDFSLSIDITDMANTGEFRALYRAWFEQPITTRVIGLGAAPGQEWQSVLAVPHARPAD